MALVDGRTPQEGRLEVQYNGVWGTVCDDGFTDAAARVVCCSLGFGYVDSNGASGGGRFEVRTGRPPAGAAL